MVHTLRFGKSKKVAHGRTRVKTREIMLLQFEGVAILEFRCNIAMVHFEEHSIKKLLIEHYNL